MTLSSPAQRTMLTVPIDKRYRVIQWGVGNVGTIGLRHFVNNPAYELVGVLCSRPEKVGKSAGELAGFEPTGLTRHDLDLLDPEAALTLLCARYPTLAPRVRQRLLDEAQGNPLALLELPRSQISSAAARSISMRRASLFSVAGAGSAMSFSIPLVARVQSSAPPTCQRWHLSVA